jgi:hypothetical protein
VRRRPALIVAATALVVGLVVVAAGIWLRPGSSSSSAAGEPSSPSTTAATSSSPTPKPCSVWGCTQDARFAATVAYLKTIKNGHVGIEVKDRVTGAVWLGGEPTYRIWAGSTPKLALSVALLEEDRNGAIQLDTTAHNEISAMLHVSDNDAATALWNRYVGSATTAAAMMSRWQTVYGMKTVNYEREPNDIPHFWGFVKCSPEDLAALMSYILDKLDPTDRAYIVDQMQHVGDIQKWGVWGAGAAQQPGVKDGWSREYDNGVKHQINATVGFAGPDQRYIVTAMYTQNPGGDTLTKGVQVLTNLAALVFGQKIPAPAVIPDEASNA